LAAAALTAAAGSLVLTLTLATATFSSSPAAALSTLGRAATALSFSRPVTPTAGTVFIWHRITSLYPERYRRVPVPPVRHVKWMDHP